MKHEGKGIPFWLHITLALLISGLGVMLVKHPYACLLSIIASLLLEILNRLAIISNKISDHK